MPIAFLVGDFAAPSMDMSRRNTEAHFASRLGLCPDNRISGDKVRRFAGD
jgi:hypothetical protein